jgi:hypothetical protein
MLQIEAARRMRGIDRPINTDEQSACAKVAPALWKIRHPSRCLPGREQLGDPVLLDYVLERQRQQVSQLQGRVCRCVRLVNAIVSVQEPEMALFQDWLGKRVSSGASSVRLAGCRFIILPDAA